MNKFAVEATLLLFIISYCVQPMLIDTIKYNGCANSSTFIFLIPHYLSMVVVGFLPTKCKLQDCEWKKILFISIMDLINQVLKKVGLIYSGSALYVIIDSSTLIFTAMWRKIILKKKLLVFQLIGILLITFGIAIKSNTLKVEIHGEEIIGSILIISSNILTGFIFVLNEKYMHKMDGPNIVCLMGIFCSSAIFIWTFIWTIPNFDNLILKNIIKNNGNINIIIISFIFLFLFNLITSSTLWYIMKTKGSLYIGILKGLKVVIIFMFSHIFFCKYDSKQCLNLHSSLSVAFCMTGVIVYSYNDYLMSVKDKLTLHKMQNDPDILIKPKV
ncbi:drug metabolite transporter, putative [Plasmodium berghei]|uniref:Drug/metabolite transporter DMT2 n=2 Tax=Plasmodium berghei TaxID=5821 RepID=A0A509AGR7_PLABA|nr:drug/metabolite transporter DMT2 [Plasmodium berghei ANKA]CXI18763.1 drug metabolite transporter, putative [Plasmodium berghei]SCM19800.1 drug metabolite transporter, putative [Plasmodium berghei]SCN23540.1 drug metabolite transporter, putative [Plasmodium berghei]SCO59134.1 drug metabolite transporter, putative [Plasmodium berghei]SCO59866.1 drug metabolite transporter, putative [Plasmodium berghei]|eukprot:XP_034420646.1 drug/metabolite transporter DMT2 [Plasmodium berghei ANKA]